MNERKIGCTACGAGYLEALGPFLVRCDWEGSLFTRDTEGNVVLFLEPHLIRFARAGSA